MLSRLNLSSGPLADQPDHREATMPSSASPARPPTRYLAPPKVMSLRSPWCGGVFRQGHVMNWAPQALLTDMLTLGVSQAPRRPASHPLSSVGRGEQERLKRPEQHLKSPRRSCTEPKQDEDVEVPDASGAWCLQVQALGWGRKRSNMRGKPKPKYDARVSGSSATRLGKCRRLGPGFEPRSDQCTMLQPKFRLTCPVCRHSLKRSWGPFAASK